MKRVEILCCEAARECIVVDSIEAFVLALL